jgi:SagB-type dehydrogenase family enzyme
MGSEVSARLVQVREYHQRTKHRLDRYAAGPDFLDWEQQPDPFRRFHDAPLIPLPLAFDGEPDPTLNDLRNLPHKPLVEWSLPEISMLLRYSLGLAAWKVYGPDRWALRCNPSSGNLHPTEGYLVVRGVKSLADGLYHYAPHEHALEMRATFAPESGRTPAILLGLSSIAWREAWKYGERAYRYVHLDLGHAIGALAYAAALLGSTLQRVDADEAALAALMGLDRSADFVETERERPDLLLSINTGGTNGKPEPLDGWLAQARAASWHGRANVLSSHPKHHWPAIDEVAEATPAEVMPEERLSEAITYPPAPAFTGGSLRQLMLQRRSAQAFNGKSSLPRETFFQLLDSLLSRTDSVPWSSWPCLPRLHPVLFVHRVDDLPSGLYLLSRRAGVLPGLKQAMRDEFLWRAVEGCPAHLPLHHLISADAKRAARTLSCHQDIAASSFFSLGMLAEFDGALDSRGARAYPELFWEAGLIGQVLYLQAEAAGLRGTGIGCFFDDAVHETLGLQDSRFQSLYHFTVGQPKQDDRLQTLPPYHHLQHQQRS